MSPELGREKVSLKHGYWFYFEDEGTQIVAHGSALSGKETVFVDSEIISSKYSFKLRTTHDFENKNSQYTLIFAFENLLTGTITCSLYKNGTLIKATTKSYVKSSFVWKSFFIAMAVGAVFGFSAVWLAHRLF